jgi:very-short-patch-repair endonuclease
MRDSRQRQLRKHQTDAERKLWERLRRHQLGFKFRRQHPVGGYIADFACVEHRLIVEADGGQHADEPADLVRTQGLRALGWRVIRFWNNEILQNPDGVIEAIFQVLWIDPHPGPLPHVEEGEKEPSPARRGRVGWGSCRG